jgi:hypothetical protein
MMSQSFRIQHDIPNVYLIIRYHSSSTVHCYMPLLLNQYADVSLSTVRARPLR